MLQKKSNSHQQSNGVNNNYEMKFKLQRSLNCIKTFFLNEKTNYLMIIALALIILNSGCTSTYYPNTINTPDFSERGELVIGAYGGSSGFNPQIAYSVTDNIGVMANAAFLNDSDSETKDYHNYRFYEGGIGYYTTFLNYGRASVFSGYGHGSNEIYTDMVYDQINNVYYSETRIVDFSRFFIQPSFGVSKGFFETNFALRAAFISSTHSYVFSSKNYDVFFEPVFTAKAGFDVIKFYLQFGYTFSATYYDNIVPERNIISFGIQAKIDTK